MRKPIIAANWKMYKTGAEAQAFLQAITDRLPEAEQVEAVICAPFLHLPALVELAKDLPLKIGAQNMHYAQEGAYTGEVSPVMLAACGVDYVIIGHSERRTYYNETDETVQKKAKVAHEHGLIPIICVGEKLVEREAGQTTAVVKQQVEQAFATLTAEEAAKSVIAYEPIWAIGTGRSSSPEDANEVIGFIRQCIAEQFTSETAAKIRIQYGGSVKPETIGELMQQEQIDGALVGGASLDPQSFLQLVEGSGQ